MAKSECHIKIGIEPLLLLSVNSLCYNLTLCDYVIRNEVACITKRFYNAVLLKGFKAFNMGIDITLVIGFLNIRLRLLNVGDVFFRVINPLLIDAFFLPWEPSLRVEAFCKMIALPPLRSKWFLRVTKARPPGQN